MVGARSVELFVDYVAVRLNGPKAAGKKAVINFILSDTDEHYVLMLDNCILKHRKNKQSDEADCTVTLTREVLNEVLTGRSTPVKKILSRELKLDGKIRALQEVLASLDNFDYWFELVAPNPPPDHKEATK